MSKRDFTNPDGNSLRSETSNRAVFVCDEKGNILSSSLAVTETASYSAGEIVGQNLSQLCDNTDVTRQSLTSGLQIAHKDGHWDKKCTLIAKDGSRVAAKLEILPLLGRAASPARYLAIIDRSIGRPTSIASFPEPLPRTSVTPETSAFLALAAHDLRTPLGALQLLIRATLEQASDRDNESSNAERASNSALSGRLNSMMRQTDEMGWLIRCLASLSLIASNARAARFETADLSNLAASTIQRLAGLARLANSEINLHAPDVVSGQWPRVLLEDAIFYVIRRAIKVGANKSIEVRVGSDNAGAWISVDGIGVSDRRGATIFELDLGLWTAREIARALGGSISTEESISNRVIATIHAPFRKPIS